MEEILLALAMLALIVTMVLIYAVFGGKEE